jgi:hypothetical protein
MMRDEGFDFYRYEPMCENLFANGFDAQPGLKYALLTAWEVFEHLEDPLAEIEKMLSFSTNIFFSTQLLPPSPKPLEQWWYYGLEHGQHLSFYTESALKIIAHQFNLKLYSSKGHVHFIGNSNINPFFVKIAFHSRYRWLRKFFEKPHPSSLLEQDRVAIMGENLP